MNSSEAFIRMSSFHLLICLVNVCINLALFPLMYWTNGWFFEFIKLWHIISFVIVLDVIMWLYCFISLRRSDIKDFPLVTDDIIGE
jgi:hypothetical protein